MPEITKRRVTMRTSIIVGHNEDGKAVLQDHVMTDYVRPDHLDAYVADARKNWQSVEVSDEPDAGPGGYEGETHVPDHLALPDAGAHYPATEKG